MQVRNNIHTHRSIDMKEQFESGKRSCNEDIKVFFKLFEESTFEGSRAVARKMKKIAKRQIKINQTFMLFHSLLFLIRTDSEMLSWPNSPLLVMLQFVDPNVLTGREHQPLQAGEKRDTPLNHLADMVDPSDYSTHENLLILAKQLIDHGADVNAVSIPHGKMSLHFACYGGNVTNLDFVELLLEKGADPNAQDHMGLTPLMSTTRCTTGDAPGAAKFLLNWPTTDANITAQSGASFLARVRLAITDFSIKSALPTNPSRVQHQFLLQQWRDIEEMLVERGP
jgi:hypothetical protein